MSRSYTLAVLRWLWINVIIRFDPHTYNREGSLTCTPLYITVWSSPPSWADQQAVDRDRMNQRDWLGYDVAEEFHFESSSRGFSYVDIHKYNWTRIRSHGGTERSGSNSKARGPSTALPYYEPAQSCPISFLTSLQAGTSTKRSNQRKIESSSYASGMTGIASAWRWTRRSTE